jgi:excisionase family DNA binding protein
MFSLSQAAKLAGVSKATIHRAIKSGRLSATRQDDGSYQIDPAELYRVYEMP